MEQLLQFKKPPLLKIEGGRYPQRPLELYIYFCSNTIQAQRGNSQDLKPEILLSSKEHLQRCGRVGTSLSFSFNISPYKQSISLLAKENTALELLTILPKVILGN